MIYIAGATGFLGKRTVEFLAENNKELLCLVRDDSSKNKLSTLKERFNKQIDFIRADLLDEESLTEGLKRAEKAVYMVRLEYVDLLKNFLSACMTCGIKRVVFISSTTVLLSQESRVKKLKLEAEGLIKNSGLDYTILRPSMIYGGEGDGNFSKMIDFIKKKGFFVIFGSGENLIQPVHVRDVSKAIEHVLSNKKTYNRIYELCGKSPLKYIDMLKIVRLCLKRNFRIIKLPVGMSKMAVSVYKKIAGHSLLETDQIDRMKIDKTYSYKQAEKDFGYGPLSFEEGIKLQITEMEK